MEHKLGRFVDVLMYGDEGMDSDLAIERAQKKMIERAVIEDPCPICGSKKKMSLYTYDDDKDENGGTVYAQIRCACGMRSRVLSLPRVDAIRHRRDDETMYTHLTAWLRNFINRLY